MIPERWLFEAQERISPYILQTPTLYDADLQTYFKWENRQISGSFKLRGAYNKILTLQPWELERGVVTASAGNHGLAVALACQQLGAQATIFVSEHAVPVKIEAIQNTGAQIRAVPGGYSEAEQAGIKFARESQGTWVSPYNDGQVIAGQGTLALEILQDLPDIDDLTWIVPVGGGGLISGIGAALRAHEKRSQRTLRHRLVGVQSEASPFFHALFHHGTQDGVQEEPSLADGLAGAVEPGSLTIPLARNFVDEMVLVSEEQIARGMAFAWHHYQETIEGSGATALAAVLFGKVKPRPAVVVISGGNAQPEIHRQIVAQFPG
ncbi:MAG: pyridoxal-phosphate dependent enzyme [Anaerolineales bacterium]|nr:pyridoxal-phosphate dependent enzyme [Anaerolineales bacterium]